MLLNIQAEKSKHDEKEMKKLQDSVQSLQLRLTAREHICRTLQEKVINIKFKLDDHGFISKEYISIGMRPFGEAQSKAIESLCSKWTISYHCGKS